MFCKMKKFIVLINLFVLSTNVWGMPDQPYEHTRRWSSPGGLWSLESPHYMSSNIVHSRECSIFNRTGSHIKEESDSIDIDVFMSELLEAYDEEESDIDGFISELLEVYYEKELKEVDDSARVKLQTNSNCKKSSWRKKSGRKSSRRAIITENKNIRNRSEKKGSDLKPQERQQSRSIEQRIIVGLHEAQNKKKQVQKKLKRKNFRENVSKFISDNIGKFLANIVFSIFKRWGS